MKRATCRRLVKLQERIVQIEKARRSVIVSEAAELTNSYERAIDLVMVPGAIVPPELSGLCCRAIEAKLRRSSQAIENIETKVASEGKQLRLFEGRAKVESKQNQGDLERRKSSEITEMLGMLKARTRF